MEFLNEKIEHYIESHSTPESEMLAELNRETWSKVLRPRMLSGHLQGRVLSMFSKMIQPRRILEIGTYTGYSAICLAEGLREDGFLHTIDINDELENMARSYIERAGYGEKIKIHIGDAKNLIPTLDEAWDIIFIDADKQNYSLYYKMVFEKLKPGGYIIADNVLWSGKVVEEIKKNDTETRELIAFNKMVSEDERVENVLLPVRDGLMMVRKK